MISATYFFSILCLRHSFQLRSNFERYFKKGVMSRVASSVKRNCDNETPKNVTIVTMTKISVIYSYILNLGM